MNLYPLVRPAFFTIDPEVAHNLTMAFLGRIGPFARLKAGQITPWGNERPLQIMGLTFPNRVGLAAGLDKNAHAVDGLAALGFGSIEVGTVTPRPQPGNPKPRLFRLPHHEAIINRMGFNNEGVNALLSNLARHRYKGIIGINIGKNATTPIEKAANDYLHCLDLVYPRASYVTVNISSPNTKNLRQLQGEDELDALLAQLRRRQLDLADRHGKYVPLVLKIAPDLDSDQLDAIATQLQRHAIDGVIATNTTVDRQRVGDSPAAHESGGLSGRPLFERSTAIVAGLAKRLDGALPIIAAGGIMSGDDAKGKLDAGASLVQLYSGLIYRGPALVTECRRALAGYQAHSR